MLFSWNGGDSERLGVVEEEVEEDEEEEGSHEQWQCGEEMGQLLLLRHLSWLWPWNGMVGMRRWMNE